MTPAVLVSPLASWSVGRADRPKRAGGLFGVACHTTGSGVVDKAFAAGKDPLALVAEVYGQPGAFSGTYAIGWDGTIVSVMSEDLEAQHIGFPSGDHQAFLDGTWKPRVCPVTLEVWRARWPDVASPAHLFPGPSPNQVYLGIEFVPVTNGAVARGIVPAASGLTFTAEQFTAGGELVRDIGARWALDLTVAGTLVGHEDVNPLERSDAGGGWDPGAMRQAPRFDWARIRAAAGLA